MAFRRPRRPTALNLCPGRQAAGPQKSGPPSPLADNRKSSGPRRCLVYGASWRRLPGALNQGQDGKYQQKPGCGKEAVALNRTPSPSQPHLFPPIPQGGYSSHHSVEPPRDIKKPPREPWNHLHYSISHGVEKSIWCFPTAITRRTSTSWSWKRCQQKSLMWLGVANETRADHRFLDHGEEGGSCVCLSKSGTKCAGASAIHRVKGGDGCQPLQICGNQSFIKVWLWIDVRLVSFFLN